MKVNQWKGNESNYSKDYISGEGKTLDTRDVYQSYNSAIDNVISQCYGMMSDAFKRLKDSEGRARVAAAEVEEVNRKLVAARSEIQVTGQGKEQRLAQLIAHKKNEAVESAAIFSDEMIERSTRRIEQAKAVMDNPQVSVTREAIKQEVLASKSEAGAVSNAAKSVLDSYNGLYTEFGSNGSGGWSREFYDNYQKVKAKVFEDPDEMMRVVGENYTRDKVLAKYSSSYRKSPYTVIKMLFYLFLLPIAMVKYKYNEKSITKCLSIIIKDIKFNNNRFARIATIIAWLIELRILLSSGTVVLVISALILVSLLGCFFLTKKKLKEQINEMIVIDACYEHMIGSIDAQVEEQYQAALNAAKADAVNKYNALVVSHNDMLDKNKAAREEALRNFDASKIDKSELEAEYAKMIQEMRERINSLEKKLEECRKAESDIKEQRQPLYTAYNDAKAKVQAMLSADDERNGFTIEGRQFCLAFAQTDALAILRTNNVKNAMGMIMSLTGRVIASAEASADAASDLPPVSIPIDIVPVTKEQVKAICSNRDWYDSVYEDLRAIMATVNKNIKNDLTASGVDTTNIDMSEFYKFVTVNHGLRCSVVFYNSAEDRDSIRTITNLCIHNIIHPTVCTTDKRGLSFRIFAKDRTAFDAVDYSIGASIEQANSMSSNHFYEVYDNSDYEKIITELYNSGLNTAKEIGNIASNIVEYRAKKMIGGSSPTRITYAIFVDDVDKFWSGNLRQLLNGTGGTQTGGHATVGENKYGVVPILFLDLAELMAEKPDSSVINKYEEIANAIAFNNFFYIKSNTDSLKKYDRKEVQAIIDSARVRSR